jgi:hypothetical protein
MTSIIFLYKNCIPNMYFLHQSNYIFYDLQYFHKLKDDVQRKLVNSHCVNSKGEVTICPHIDMKAADGSLVIGWLASQTDMLAEDWIVVE